MTYDSLRFHELANIFPLLSAGQLQELASDIKANGLRELITLFDGQILDGRNRYNATKLAGSSLTSESFELFEGTADDAVAFVISKNILRRHLTNDQRAQIAADLYEKLPKKKVGRDRKQLSPISDNLNPPKETEGPLPSADSQKKKVATQMRVSVKQLERAAAIQNKDPQKAAEVKAGTKKTVDAEKELKPQKPKPVAVDKKVVSKHIPAAPVKSEPEEEFTNYRWWWFKELDDAAYHLERAIEIRAKYQERFEKLSKQQQESEGQLIRDMDSIDLQSVWGRIDEAWSAGRDLFDDE